MKPLHAVVDLQRDGSLSSTGGVRLDTTGKISGKVLVQLLNLGLV